MRKKVLVIGLMAAMTVSFTACGKSSLGTGSNASVVERIRAEDQNMHRS